MSEHKLTPTEIRFLEEVLDSDYKIASIRLREGEYQYELSKAIANLQLLELYFPNVKDLVKKLYGEEKVSDVQLIRKTQTILKKLERSGVIKILPKTKPWELQRYALLSLKFIDSDKNHVFLATKEQVQQAREKLKTIINQHKVANYPTAFLKLRAYILAFIIALSHAVLVWNLLQPVIDPIVVVGSFSIAILFSVTLGRILSKD